MSKHVITKAAAAARALSGLMAKGIPVEESQKFVSELLAHRKYDACLTLPPYTYQLYRLSEEFGGLDKTFPKIRELSKQWIFDPSVRSHINLVDSPEHSVQSRGKLFARRIDSSGKSSMEEASREEISEANVFAMGGIDFDTTRHLSALLKSVDTLKGYVAPKSNWVCNPLAMYPAVSKEERYDAAVKYSLHKTYFPKYIYQFVEDVILPRMKSPINPYKLRPAEEEITFFSYSVGGREVYMIENAIRSAMQIRGQSQKEVLDVFKKINGVCIGYAVDIKPMKKAPYFTKVIVYNEADTGVLIPKSTYDFLGRWDRSDGGYAYRIKTKQKFSHDQYVFLISGESGIFPWEEDRFLGHGLNSYIKAIDGFESPAREAIGICFYAAKDSMTESTE